MKRVAIFLSLLLAACGEPELTPKEQEAADLRAIAEVAAAQEIPPTPVTPDPVTYADIEQNDLSGAECSFILESGLAQAPDGEGVLALAQGEAAYVKIDGDIHRLAPDAGSPELPLGARGKYDGREYVLIIDLAAEEGEQSGMETVDFPARMELRNQRDQVVYGQTGIAQCGS